MRCAGGPPEGVVVDQMPRGERPAPVEDDRPDRHARMVCARPAASGPAAASRCYGLRGGYCEGGGVGCGCAGGGGAEGGDQAGAGERARLVFTIRMRKITASPASMSSTPIMMGTRMPPAM